MNKNKKLIMTQKGLSSYVVELSTKELKYIIDLVEADLEYPYDTETFLVFNLLYEKLLKLNK